MPKGSRSSPVASITIDSPEKQRKDQLNKLLDHCAAAQAIADVQGDKFLSYMLAMTIQAARGSMLVRR